MRAQDAPKAGSRVTRGILGFANGFAAALALLGLIWLVGGAVAVVWGLITWNGVRAIGGFLGLVVGGFLVGVNAIRPSRHRRDRWANLRASDPLRRDLRAPDDFGG